MIIVFVILVANYPVQAGKIITDKPALFLIRSGKGETKIFLWLASYVVIVSKTGEVKLKHLILI